MPTWDSCWGGKESAALWGSPWVWSRILHSSWSMVFTFTAWCKQNCLHRLLKKLAFEGADVCEKEVEGSGSSCCCCYKWQVLKEYSLIAWMWVCRVLQWQLCTNVTVSMLQCDPSGPRTGPQTDRLLPEKRSMSTLFFEEVTSKTSLSVNLQKLSILCHKILPLSK